MNVKCHSECNKYMKWKVLLVPEVNAAAHSGICPMKVRKY